MKRREKLEVKAAKSKGKQEKRHLLLLQHFAKPRATVYAKQRRIRRRLGIDAKRYARVLCSLARCLSLSLCLFLFLLSAWTKTRCNLRTSEQFVNVNNDESSGRSSGKRENRGSLVERGGGLEETQQQTRTVGLPIRKQQSNQLKMFPRWCQAAVESEKRSRHRKEKLIEETIKNSIEW